MHRRNSFYLGALILDQFGVWLSLHTGHAVSARWLPLGNWTWLLAAVLAGLFWYLAPALRTSRGWPLVWTGLASNLMTVATRGHVVDYLPLFWWVVNVADIILIAGIILLGVHLLFPNSISKVDSHKF